VLPAAQALAAEIARLPQACLRSDRLSVLEAEGLDMDTAMANEVRRGLPVLGEALDGAARFAAGAGRHGSSAAG
jgi:enoyl-CoA hydratase